MLVTACERGGACKTLGTVGFQYIPSAPPKPWPDLHCDRNGKLIGGDGGACPAEEGSYFCRERWSADPLPPTQVFDATDDLGLGLRLLPNALSAQVTYSDIPFESPHQASGVALPDTRSSIVGNFPFDAQVADFPAECPLN